MPPTATLTQLTVSRETILELAQTLPAAPQVLGGLAELLEDVNADLDQVAQQIRMDPALSARVIRLSNSTIFGGGAAVNSVEAAVSRVGFREVTRLVGLATVSRLVDRALAAYAVSADRLRESLLMHALASEALAGSAGLDARMAYAAGLLRGVGMMVLDRAVRGRLAPGDAFDADHFATYAEWERVHFGMTGTEATGAILRGWRFPEELVSAIERHLAPGVDALANLLNLGGAIVASHGFALSGEATQWELEPEKLSAAGLDLAHWREASTRVAGLFERQRQALY